MGDASKRDTAIIDFPELSTLVSIMEQPPFERFERFTELEIDELGPIDRWIRAVRVLRDVGRISPNVGAYLIDWFARITEYPPDPLVAPELAAARARLKQMQQKYNVFERGALSKEPARSEWRRLMEIFAECMRRLSVQAMRAAGEPELAELRKREAPELEEMRRAAQQELYGCQLDDMWDAWDRAVERRECDQESDEDRDRFFRSYLARCNEGEPAAGEEPNADADAGNE